MAAQAFAEVVGTPYSAWLAPVGTAEPKIDTPEDSFIAAWKQLGTNGINNQGAAGVTVSLGSTESHFTPAGGTLPVKGWRTDEAVVVSGSIVDTTVEQFAVILDDAAVTTVPASSGVAAKKSIALVRGVAMEYRALLVRGISPYDDGSGKFCQYLFNRVFQTATQAPKYLKGTPAELAWEFTIAGTVSGTDPALYSAAT